MTQQKIIGKPPKVACLKPSGGCSIGARDKNGFCLHQKYCNHKKAVPFDKFTIDGEKEKEIEEKKQKLRISLEEAKTAPEVKYKTVFVG